MSYSMACLCSYIVTSASGFLRILQRILIAFQFHYECVFSVYLHSGHEHILSLLPTEFFLYHVASAVCWSPTCKSAVSTYLLHGCSWANGAVASVSPETELELRK
jgi:hypothetical protein